MTRTPVFSDHPVVFTPKIDRPYFEAWLRRTGKQFAVSGRLSQTAMMLAAEDGSSMEEWRTRLRILLEGNEVPSLDLLTKIDMLLAGPTRRRPCDDGQFSFFKKRAPGFCFIVIINRDFGIHGAFACSCPFAILDKSIKSSGHASESRELHGESYR